MPSLLRFLGIVAVIGGIIYGSLFALSLIDPPQREISVTVPPDRFIRN